MSLKCKVCAETYNSGDYKPLLLPCGRVMCYSCVLRWLRGSQKCYMCHDYHQGVTVGSLQVMPDLIPPEDYRSPYPSLTPSITSAGEGMIALVIRGTAGQMFRVKVPPNARVKDVKETIRREFGVVPVRLLFEGLPLQDDKTLTDCNIRDGNNLGMSTKFVGGHALFPLSTTTTTTTTATAAAAAAAAAAATTTFAFTSLPASPFLRP